MTRRAAGEHPKFQIGPVLQHYGGELPEEGLGPKPYKCPFHGDSRASGTVNTEEGWFNCFANDCPKGNAVQIIMKQEGVAYEVAVKRASEISGGSNLQVQPTSRRGRASSGGTRNRQGTRRFGKDRGRS